MASPLIVNGVVVEMELVNYVRNVDDPVVTMDGVLTTTTTDADSMTSIPGSGFDVISSGQFVLPRSTGWQCPRCGRIWSPQVQNCNCTQGYNPWFTGWQYYPDWQEYPVTVRQDGPKSS